MQKNNWLKDLMNINRILEKVKEGENKVVFSRVTGKKEMCVIGVSDTSYKQDDSSISGEMVMIGNVNEKRVAPIFLEKWSDLEVVYISKSCRNKGCHENCG